MKKNYILLTLLLILPAISACGSLAPEPDPVTVTLSPDGSGEYASLAAAVEAIPAGSTINLEPGTYVLDEPLEIFKSLNLMGAGMEQTAITSAAGEYVVLFGGDGLLTAEGIAFRHEGEAAADVVVIIQEAEVTLSQCRFTGATFDDETIAHAGLRFQGSSSGTVSDCEAVANGNYGILVEGEAELLLEGNNCSGNESAGIAYYGESGGTARLNECLDNGTGILVVADAQPTLEENTCTGNDLFGIAYLGNSGGTARQNQCSSNQVTGIQVDGRAQPTLEENICSFNVESGIAYLGTSAGVARGNECNENQGGIRVVGQAAPTLERNICADNVVAGLAFGGEASGVAQENECYGNDVGIIIGGTSTPELVDNNVHDNILEEISDWRP